MIHEGFVQAFSPGGEECRFVQRVHVHVGAPAAQINDGVKWSSNQCDRTLELILCELIVCRFFPFSVTHCRGEWSQETGTVSDAPVI